MVDTTAATDRFLDAYNQSMADACEQSIRAWQAFHDAFERAIQESVSRLSPSNKRLYDVMRLNGEFPIEALSKIARLGNPAD